MLKLTMKPTGWFHIGWSGEIAPGQAVPMKYFGQELVAFRSDTGELTVLDAHCKHLGAHLGHGGRVRKNCVICPYHGWSWDDSGLNTNVPYQEQPTGARLRKWHVVEQYGLIYLWHDPAGGPPRQGWELIDLFNDFPEVPADEKDYYPAYPHAVVIRPDEPIHPQLIQENAADCMHFRHTHGAPEDPVLESFDTSDGRWHGCIGFISPKTQEIALRVRTRSNSVGLAFAMFEGGSTRYRLVLSATPIDDEKSFMRVSYFLPRDAKSPEVMPKKLRDFAKQTEELFEEDARIWRHQVFVNRPVYAKQDIAGYTALRKWCERFYESDDGLSPTVYVDEL